MLAAEHPNEVRWIGIADALGNDVDALGGMQQEASCLGHASGDDPLAGASPRRLPQRGRQVGRAPLHGSRHVARREGTEAVALDEAQRLDDDATPADVGVRVTSGHTFDLGQDERHEAPLDALVRGTRLQGMQLAEQ